MPTPRYSAEAFFNPTAYELAGHFAFSPDDRRLLMSSDETGVFNVYWLDTETGGNRITASNHYVAFCDRHLG